MQNRARGFYRALSRAFTTGQYAQHITPEQARETLARLMAEGWGIIASDYIWTTRQTAHRAWLGGYKKDGEPVTAPDALKKSSRSVVRAGAGAGRAAAHDARDFAFVYCKPSAGYLLEKTLKTNRRNKCFDISPF
ncbi:hypothetical protein [Porphyromonas macacae]|uniref:hypothetical protein n=1 Tax=Porphyromonas macacae TaxID=28115 RepID=UPI0024ACCF8B|nr:hypothetical protein [Porphyromonas macacae]